MKYEKLFTPGKLGNMTVKNRIVMPPMGTGMEDDQICLKYSFV